jgi:hypothetical protein
VNVHGVIDAQPAGLGQLVLDDGRKYGRPVPLVQRHQREQAGSIHAIGPPANARKRLFDTFKLADGQVELPPDARVCAGHHRRHFSVGNAKGRQRYGTASRQALHQHAPPLPDTILPANDPVHGDEHIPSPCRSIHEGCPDWQMPLTDFHPGRGRNERKVMQFSVRPAGLRVKSLECSPAGWRPARVM